MKVLVACEYSGVVRDAFLKLGKKIDSEKDMKTFVKLKKEEYQLQVRHQQYMILIDDHRKNEAIKSAKRRGMK